MSAKNYTRRNFIGRTTAGLAGAAAFTGMAPVIPKNESPAPGLPNEGPVYPASSFATEVQRLPEEKIYDYHKRLSTAPVHISRRDNYAVKENDEMQLPDTGWSIFWIKGSGAILDNAVDDFIDYLSVSQNVMIDAEPVTDLNNWKRLKQAVVAGTKDQMPGCGLELKGPKDYEIQVTPNKIVDCGYAQRGAKFGLYNL